MKGLTQNFTIEDLEVFLRARLEFLKSRQSEGNINLYYADGMRDLATEMIETFFGGL